MDTAGLGVLPAGPGLAAALERIHPQEVSAGGLVDLVAAAQRVACWADGVRTAAAAELGRRPVYARR